MIHQDLNDKVLKNGDIINIHQTVNGENIFIVLDIEDLDIRYGHDISVNYQYDKDELLSRDKFTSEIEWEIVGNLYDYISTKR